MDINNLVSFHPELVPSSPEVECIQLKALLDAQKQLNYIVEKTKFWDAHREDELSDLLAKGCIKKVEGTTNRGI